jgi:hypothetical protein
MKLEEGKIREGRVGEPPGRVGERSEHGQNPYCIYI